MKRESAQKGLNATSDAKFANLLLIHQARFVTLVNEPCLFIFSHPSCRL